MRVSRTATHVWLEKDGVVGQQRLRAIHKTSENARTAHQTLLYAIRQPLDKVHEDASHCLIDANRGQRGETMPLGVW
jgi:hypothetical protein